MIAKDLQTRLRCLGNPKDAAFLAGFFKTGPGEYGDRDVTALEDFLGRHCRVMPRTMLRYATERLPERKRRS